MSETVSGEELEKINGYAREPLTEDKVFVFRVALCDNDIDRDGEKKTPVVLHRAILGSLDRFMAYILEETKGNLPTWLAPVQVRVMPVKTDDDSLNAYAKEICDALKANKVRVDLDDRSEKLGYRMREGQIQKVPYLLVIGFNEQENKTVSYRLHGEQDTTTLPLDEFVEKIDTEIKNKTR